ncbi:Probable U3 small nucleolar RNA-associated protein 7 [Linum grandiflorum]
MGVEEENGGSTIILPPTEQELQAELDTRVQKYRRGKSADLEALTDKKLKGQQIVREKLHEKSSKVAANCEKWLVGSSGGNYIEAEGIEKTWRIRQDQIAREVNTKSSSNQYDIVLPDLGPYTVDILPSGRYMALAGRKGHVAIVDLMSMNTIREMQVKETVRDVAFLHNETFFAVAQKKYPYIYNRDGTELHCLREHGPVSHLQFLKNHFLLASLSTFGQLRYQDVTTGGTVTMWKPTSPNPLVKMLCHPGPISAVAFHPNGHLMATAGREKKIKIWDLRKFEVVQTIPGHHANTLDFSQKGLLAAGTGSYAHVFGDLSGSGTYSRYMGHSMVKGYQIGKVSFRPYEDVLVLGHSRGWSSILVPGSGEPNFDSWVANPYETSKQRREKEIHNLLDKLPPEAIMLDPSKIGTVRNNRRKEKATKQEMEEEKEAAVEAVKEIALKKKTKGRNKTSKRVMKRKVMVDKAKKPFLEKQKQEEGKVDDGKKRKHSDETAQLPASLQRFVRKKAAT